MYLKLYIHQRLLDHFIRAYLSLSKNIILNSLNQTTKMWKHLSYILIVSRVQLPPTQLHCEHPKDFSGFPEHSTHLSTWHSKGWPPYRNVRLRKYKYSQSSGEIKQQVWFESKDYRIYISSHGDFSVWYCLRLMKIK